MLVWEAIGAVAELLSSFGVLITLIYLASQVRHARAEVRGSVRQSRSETLSDLFLSRLNNPSLIKVHSQSGASPLKDALHEKFSLSDEDAWCGGMAWIRSGRSGIPFSGNT